MAEETFDLEKIARVVINSEGEAVNPKRAREEYGIIPDIVFIRDDGWTLGAEKRYKNVAYKMWSDCWTDFYDINKKKLLPITEYNS